MARERPEIKYPCVWTYAVIGWDEEDLRMAIAALVRGRGHSLSFSRKSEKGKYIAMHLELTVVSEQDRDELFMALKSHPKVKMVL